MASTAKGAAGRRKLDLPLPTAAESDDRRLVAHAADGDRRAFEAIFRRHHRELFRYCRAMLGNADEGEDALQSTMVKALRALPGERREIALRPWLFRVAHNEAIGILRARRSVTELDPEQIDLTGGVAERVETRERLRRLVDDLKELSERQRGALIMRELNGIPFAEIGAAFGTSEAAAKQTVYEARTSLHQMVEGRDMTCASVQEAISSEDGRRLRSRRIRAHLRQCGSCRGFEASIAERRADLAALAPPLAAPAVLAALGAASGSGAAAGGTIGATAAAKSIAAVLATITIAGGAAKVGGLVDFGAAGGGRDSSPARAIPEAGANGAASPAGGALHDLPRPLALPPSPERPGRPAEAGTRAHGRADRSAHQPTTPVGGPGRAHAPPGQSRTPPGQTSTPPGQSRTPPGHASASPGQTHTPPGHTRTPPGQTRTPPGQTDPPPGRAATPPGQTRTPPGQSEPSPPRGQSQVSRGHTGTPPAQAAGASGAAVERTPGGNAAGHSK